MLNDLIIMKLAREPLIRAGLTAGEGTAAVGTESWKDSVAFEASFLSSAERGVRNAECGDLGSAEGRVWIAE